VPLAENGGYVSESPEGPLDPEYVAAEPRCEGAEKECIRRRLSPEVRRAEVLDAALEVFAKVGFERATLQDVADRAGVTKGALYHYFDSKNQLFLELMRERLAVQIRASQALVAAAGSSRPREALLREFLETMWANLQQPGMVELMRLMVTELPKFPEVGRAFFDEIVAPARRTMRQIWERDGMRSVAQDEWIDAIVAVLPSMFFGVALSQHTFQGVDPVPLSAGRRGQVVVELLLQGCLAGSATEMPALHSAPDQPPGHA
jgi:AcrR family transcriptional regulator